MTKPVSYPFLAIAKAYGVDYGDVLLAADYWRGGRNSRPVQGCHAIERIAKIVGEYKTSEIARMCQFATDQFRRIQAGLIDWNTGEPLMGEPADAEPRNSEGDEMDYGDGVGRY